MELLQVLVQLVAVVLALLVIGTVSLIGTDRVRAIRGELRERCLVAIPFIGLLAAVLAFNAQFRPLAHDISWWIGFRMTPFIVEIEGYTVAHIQDYGGPTADAFFSFMYIYGYVFLLVFPLVMYFVLERLDEFQSLTVAYTANYALGLVCYILFVVYGPRNTIPELVWEPLYQQHPQIQLLTSEVNEATNVFPSLHTSLSATVMLFAWRTQDIYRTWLPIAVFLGIAVIFSTMYLAIHWVIDVIAGFVLAWVSYRIGLRSVEKQWVGRFTPPTIKTRLEKHGR